MKRCNAIDPNVRMDHQTLRMPWCGCWLWTGDVGSDGYGRMVIDKRMRPAHRLSWERHRGRITNGLWVLHRCDVKLCINPDHLFLGTAIDNNADCMAKGRNQRRERHWAAKLNSQSVAIIRQRLSDGEMPSRLAREFGISAASVTDVKTGRTWR
jgi:hypothetical protein